MITPEPITGRDTEIVGLAEINQNPPCGVGASLGRAGAPRPPGPLESDNYLNEEWDMAGRRSKAGVDLRNNLVGVYFSPQLKESAIQDRLLLCVTSPGCPLPGLAVFRGSLITGASLTGLPHRECLRFEKESYWEGRMQTPGVPQTDTTSAKFTGPQDPPHSSSLHIQGLPQTTLKFGN